MDLTAEALEGYRAKAGDNSPHLFSSPSDLAWRVGRYMAEHGVDAPASLPPKDAARRVVNSGRGYTMSLRGRFDILLRAFFVDVHKDGFVTEIRL